MKVSELLWKEASSGNVTNDELVEIIQLCADLLNLATPEKYAKDVGKSPQAIYKSGKCTEILGKKFVIDND